MLQASSATIFLRASRFFQFVIPLVGVQYILADVLELADEVDSKSIDGDIVRVQVPPSAPNKKGRPFGLPFLFHGGALHSEGFSVNKTVLWTVFS